MTTIHEKGSNTHESVNTSNDAQSIHSIIDTDTYKLSMQQAILQHFPQATVSYHFTNRTPSMKYNKQAYEWLCNQIFSLSKLVLTKDEALFLKQKCPYFTNSYLDFLSSFRFRPKDHVTIAYADGVLELDIHGLWRDTILYEIPLLALVSEGYFKFVDTDWDYAGQKELAEDKAQRLLAAGLAFSEFGTRRRRSYKAQDIVVQALINTSKTTKGSGVLTGTSNVHFAQKYNINPVGTIAHEWYMGIAALEGYDNANRRASEKWEQTYPDMQLSIALTDTFSTKVFFKEFDTETARKWKGVRQDSGDPFHFVDDVVAHYNACGIDPSSKTVLFSDSLDVDRCLKLADYCKERGVNCGFGIGTFLTNDFHQKNSTDRSKPMNIVIKLSNVDGHAAVKISDDLLKNTGDPEVVKAVKQQFGLLDAEKEQAVRA